MAHPSKTDRETILQRAVEHLERSGVRKLSLRSLASELGLATNALYHYFPDRARLESARSAARPRRLEHALTAAAGKKRPDRAIHAVAAAYTRFAREHPNLYEVMMQRCELTGADEQAHQSLWQAVLAQVSQISGQAAAPKATVALWAFLHGVAALEDGEVLGDGKPRSSFEFGLAAWLAAAAAANPGKRAAPGRR